MDTITFSKQLVLCTGIPRKRKLSLEVDVHTLLDRVGNKALNVRLGCLKNVVG